MVPSGGVSSPWGQRCTWCCCCLAEIQSRYSGGCERRDCERVEHGGTKPQGWRTDAVEERKLDYFRSCTTNDARDFRNEDFGGKKMLINCIFNI